MELVVRLACRTAGVDAEALRGARGIAVPLVVLRLCCAAEEDIDNPCRPLPSKAHVQRSAVSVGCAAGRLTGTQGTLKARVEHSIVRMRGHRRSTSRIHVDHFHRPGVVCSSLPTTSGARQSPPEGRLRNGLLEESACRRGVRDDVEDPRRPLPSKAHVQRSAVSVGSAAGRLTGTRGTSKARVEHFIVISRRTSTIHVDHSRRRLMSNVPQSPSAAPPGD